MEDNKVIIRAQGIRLLSAITPFILAILLFVLVIVVVAINQYAGMWVTIPLFSLLAIVVLCELIRTIKNSKIIFVDNKMKYLGNLSIFNKIMLSKKVLFPEFEIVCSEIKEYKVSKYFIEFILVDTSKIGFMTYMFSKKQIQQILQEITLRSDSPFQNNTL